MQNEITNILILQGQAIRSCLAANLLAYLLPNSFEKIVDCRDLTSFMLVNREINELVKSLIISLDVIRLSCLKNLSKEDFKKVRRVLIDNNRSFNKHNQFRLLINLKEIILADGFNQIIVTGVLPASLITLKFGRDFNKPLAVGVLPGSLDPHNASTQQRSGLTNLKFGKKFNQLLTVGVLSASLTNLEFGRSFDQPLAMGVLPISLTTLKFGRNFSKSLAIGVLPDRLTSLRFGRNFNQPLLIGVLPISLTSLELGTNFNQPLAVGELPDDLTSLIFGFWFNQPLPLGVLPANLLNLTFGFDFNQYFPVGALPTSLVTLKFGNHFNQPIHPGTLPANLKNITFGMCFNQHLPVGALPTNLVVPTYKYNWYRYLKTFVLILAFASFVIPLLLTVVLGLKSYYNRDADNNYWIYQDIWHYIIIYEINMFMMFITAVTKLVIEHIPSLYRSIDIFLNFLTV